MGERRSEGTGDGLRCPQPIERESGSASGHTAGDDSQDPTHSDPSLQAPVVMTLEASPNKPRAADTGACSQRPPLPARMGSAPAISVSTRPRSEPDAKELQHSPTKRGSRIRTAPQAVAHCPRHGLFPWTQVDAGLLSDPRAMLLVLPYVRVPGANTFLMVRLGQQPGREAALAWASLAQRFPASSVLAPGRSRLRQLSTERGRERVAVIREALNTHWH